MKTERLNTVLERFPGFTTDTRDYDESPAFVVCDEGWYWHVPSNLPVMGEYNGHNVQLNDGLLFESPPALDGR